MTITCDGSIVAVALNGEEIVRRGSRRMGYGTSEPRRKSKQIRHSAQGLPTEWTHRHPGPRRKNLVPKH